MSATPEVPEEEENGAAAIAARVVFLAFLGAVAAAPVLLVLALATGRLVLLGFSLLAAGGAGLSRQWLQSQQRFGTAKAQFDAISVRADPVTPAEQRAQFIELLREWDDLEHKRGSPGFDPWAAQAVRHSIREMVAGDPELDRLFHT